MTKRFALLPLLAVTALLASACTLLTPSTATEDAGFQSDFGLAKVKLSSSGAGKYFVLQPGTRMEYTKENTKDTLTITVTKETKLVDGVETRIIEERETEAGKLIEVSRNYFAIDNATGNVYYFGEDVDMYKNDKVTGHDGSWLAGANGAKAGLYMSGAPVVGAKFYMEVAPKVAMDRGEIVSVTDTFKTPSGEYTNCVKVKETSAVEAGTEYKHYAPGVGLIEDDGFVLAKIIKP